MNIIIIAIILTIIIYHHYLFIGVVPESEIFQALLKRVLVQFQSTRRTLKLQATFGAFIAIATRAKDDQKKAKKHHFSVLAGDDDMIMMEIIVIMKNVDG